MQIYRTSYAFRNRYTHTFTSHACQVIISSTTSWLIVLGSMTKTQGVPRGGRQGAAVHLRQPAVHHHGRADSHDGHHQRVPERGVHAHHGRHPVAGVQPGGGHLRRRLRALALLPPAVRRRGPHRVPCPPPSRTASSSRCRPWSASGRTCAPTSARAPSPAATRVTAPAVRRADPGASRRGGAQVRRAQQLVRRHPGAVPQRQVRARHHDGVHGALRQEAPPLRAGGLPLVATEYGVSEGWVGANVEPETPPESVTFTVLPNIAYFEFIPLKACHGGGADDDTSYAEAEAPSPWGSPRSPSASTTRLSSPPSQVTLHYTHPISFIYKNTSSSSQDGFYSGWKLKTVRKD